MKISRIIKRRKYKSKDRINLFAGQGVADLPSGLPPKLERSSGEQQRQSVKDIVESLKKAEHDGN